MRQSQTLFTAAALCLLASSAFALYSLFDVRIDCLLGSVHGRDISMVRSEPLDTGKWLFPPSAPLLLTNADLGSNIDLIGIAEGTACANVAVNGNTAYCSYGTVLDVLDISDKQYPRKIRNILLPEGANGIDVFGDYAYAVSGNSVIVFDVTDPDNPVETGRCGAGYVKSCVAASGDYAYMVGNYFWEYRRYMDMFVVDVSDPANPCVVGSLGEGGRVTDIDVSGNYVYLARNNGLTVIDVSDPLHPTEVGYYQTTSWVMSVAIAGDFAYVAGGTSFWVIDVSSPTAPMQVGYESLPANGWDRLAVSGDYVCTANWYSGLRIIDVSDATTPVEVGFYDVGFNAFDVAISEQYAFVADYGHGLSVIDLSNPQNPIEVAHCSTPGHSFAKVALSGSYAYHLSVGLNVVDIADPRNPSVIGSYPVVGQGLAVSGNLIYVAAGQSGLRVIDVSNPMNPVEMGFYDTGGTASGVAASGNYAFVADGEDGLRVIDVSNPQNMFEVGSYAGAVGAREVAIFGSYAYVVDGNLRIINISDPTNPWEVGYLGMQDIARSIAVLGDFAYIAADGDGLRAIDVSAPDNPVEVGYYDTPGHAWEVNTSGAFVFVAEYFGLFVLRHNSSPYSLLAYYPFNGNANDESGNGNDGTPVGATLCTDRFGNTNSAYYFDGIDDYIDCGDVMNDLTLPFTFAAWIKAEYLPVSRIFSSDCNPSDAGYYYGFYVQSQDGHLSISYGDGTSDGPTGRRTKATELSLPLDEWIHIAMTVRDPEDMTLYINAQDAQGYYGGSGGPMVHNEFSIRIGSYMRWQEYKYFKGAIDDVRIYARSLSLEEIETIFAASDSEGQLPDFAVNRFEIAQAVVSPNLVKNKPTVIRVFVDNLGRIIYHEPTISARLHVLDSYNNELFTRDANIIWKNNGIFSQIDVMDGLNSLNFYLSADEVTYDELRFWVELDYDNNVLEEDEENNSNIDFPEIQVFYEPAEINILYAKVKVLNLFATFDNGKLSSAYKLLAQTYPVSYNPSTDNSRWSGWSSIIVPLYWPYIGSSFAIDAAVYLLCTLWTFNELENNKYDIIIGFFSSWPFEDVPGMTYYNGNNLAIMIDGDIDPGRIQQIVAHEVGHAFGLRGEYYNWDGDENKWRANDVLFNPWRRNECSQTPFPCYNYPPLNRSQGIDVGRFVDQTAFDVEEKHPAAWAGTYCYHRPSITRCVPIPDPPDPNDPNRVDGWLCQDDGEGVTDSRTIGFMGKTSLGDEFAWITNDTYEFLVSAMKVGQIGTHSDEYQTFNTLSDSNQIWITALITSGDQVEAGNWRLVKSTVPADVLSGTDFNVTFFASGDINLTSHYFDLDFTRDDTLLFAARLPYPDGTDRIEIQKAGLPIYLRNISPNPPSIELLSPNGGSLSGIVDITWNSFDIDGDSIFADIYYSGDDGVSWIPIVFDLRESNFEWNTEDVPGIELGRIKVIVSDGVLISEDMSDNVFALGGKVPTVTILSPCDSSFYVEGQQIIFEGILVDLEDGSEPSASMTWTSSIDDTIGFGSNPLVSSLQAGTHLIMLSGSDYDGLSASDTILLTILIDSDDDGMPDYWENIYDGLYPYIIDSKFDIDSDGLSNIEEYFHDTSPINPDTDGDGYDDGVEVDNSSDPLSADSNPTTSVDSITPEVPLVPNVINYPNPFNPMTIIGFEIPIPGLVTLRIYDVSGKLVAELINNHYAASRYRIEWNGCNRYGRKMASGVYFLRLETIGGNVNKKIVILR